MKKIISFFTCLLFTFSAFAQTVGTSVFNNSVWNNTTIYYGSSQLANLANIPNLTFYKDFNANTSTLDADYSAGSPTATFTATRSATAPATYFDASGTMQTTTTSNVPRYTQGFYDENGFHLQPGLLMEASSGNGIHASNAYQDATWTASNLTAADNTALSIAGTTDASTLTATSANATIIQTSATTSWTYSVFP